MDKVQQGGKQTALALDGSNALKPRHRSSAPALATVGGGYQVLTAIYWDQGRAEQTLIELEQAGFSPEQIKVAMADTQLLAVKTTAVTAERCSIFRRLHAGSKQFACISNPGAALLEMGIPEAEVHELQRALHTGGIIIIINVGQQAAVALRILQHRHGAIVLGPAALLDTLIAGASFVSGPCERESEHRPVKLERQAYRKFVV